MSDISIVLMSTFLTQPVLPLSSTAAMASIKTIKKETQVMLTQGGWLESKREKKRESTSSNSSEDLIGSEIFTHKDLPVPKKYFDRKL